MVGDVAWAEPEATQSPVIPHEQTQTRAHRRIYAIFASARRVGARGVVTSGAAAPDSTIRCGWRCPGPAAPNGLRIEQHQLLQGAPIAEPVVAQIGGRRAGAEQQFADAQRAAADVVHHRRVRVRAPKRSGRIRHLGTSVTPTLCPNGRWHGKASPTSPVPGPGRSSRPPAGGSGFRDPGRGDGDPVLRGQVVVGGDDPDLGGIGRDRLQRRAGCARPASGRCRRSPWTRSACWRPPWRRWPTAPPPRRLRSKRPAADTTISGASALRSSGGGSRYQAERSRACCCTPDRQLPGTGVVAGSRP